MEYRKLLILGAALAFAACASGVRITGGDGTTAETAVVITGARTLEDQNEAMASWISGKAPGARLNIAESQYMLSKRVVYAARVDLPTGPQRVFYFDITDLPRQ